MLFILNYGSGNFEEHSSFHIAVGSGFLVDAMERFRCKLHMESNVVTESKLGAEDLFNNFLEFCKIKLWWDPENPEPKYLDDAEEYTVSVATRTLLLMVYKHAIKFGDSVAINALHKVLAILFQFSSSNMNSQYRPSLLNSCVDLDGLCRTDRERVESMATINYVGREGNNVAVDCMCEHKVRDCKCLIDR